MDNKKDLPGTGKVILHGFSESAKMLYPTLLIDLARQNYTDCRAKIRD